MGDIVRPKGRLLAKGHSQVVKVNFQRDLCPHDQVHHHYMHSCNRSGHGLEDLPYGCKENIFELNVRGGDLDGSTKGVHTRGEETLCVQTQ